MQEKLFKNLELLNIVNQASLSNTEKETSFHAQKTVVRPRSLPTLRQATSKVQTKLEN
jgi:hypothetical protein